MLKAKQAMALQHVVTLLQRLENADKDSQRWQHLEKLFPEANQATIAGVMHTRCFLVGLEVELVLKALIEYDVQKPAEHIHHLDCLWLTLSTAMRREIAAEFWEQQKPEMNWCKKREEVESWMETVLHDNRNIFVDMRYLENPGAKAQFVALQDMTCAMLTVAGKKGLLQ